MGKTTKPLVNLIIGIALVIIGIAWYVIDIPYLSSYLDNPITFSPLWKILAIFVIGLFGICVFFVGLILAWMGWDDYKMEKEMAKEEEPEEDWEKEEEAEGEEGAEEEEEEADEEILTKEEELEKELRAEMETENNKTELVCDICGKAVKSKAGLAAHKRVHK
ncbi:MAG: C2H2-type zinc finger protein [ANME-2 cluster archaeon]|nr:C2H2-type zinc finger protein [ANME-2 cluster archaeon]